MAEMERQWRGSAEDWAEARRVWTEGGSYVSASDAVGNRIGKSNIQRRAVADRWERGDPPEVAGSPAELIAAGTARHVEATRRSFVRRKAELVEQFAAEAERLLEQMREPAVEKVVKVVSTGVGVSEAQIVDVELAEPSPGDKQRLMTTAAIAIDKALLLAGEATSRAEVGPVSREAAVERLRHVRDEVAARREAAGVGGGELEVPESDLG